MNFDTKPLCPVCPPSSGCNRPAARPVDPFLLERYYVEPWPLGYAVRDRRNPGERALFERQTSAVAAARRLNRGLENRSWYTWRGAAAPRPFKVGDKVRVVRGGLTITRGAEGVVEQVLGGALNVSGIGNYYQDRFELVTAVEDMPKPAPRDFQVGDKVRVVDGRDGLRNGTEAIVERVTRNFLYLAGGSGGWDKSRFELVTAVEDMPKPEPVDTAEKVVEDLKAIHARVEALKAKRGNHRAFSLVSTKLDEARLWLGEVSA